MKFYYFYPYPVLRTGFFVKDDGGKMIEMWNEREIAQKYGSYPPPNYRISIDDICERLEELNEVELARKVNNKALRNNKKWVGIMSEFRTKEELGI